MEESRNLWGSRGKIRVRLIAIITALITAQSAISPIGAFATPDVASWTSHASPGGNTWSDIVYGNGIYVAVASGGDGQRVMTSTDGITWTLRTPFAEALWWTSIAFGAGIFVAVSANNDVMTSSDGISWTRRTPSSRIAWWSITYGGGLFVAVAKEGVGNRVMTSPDGINWTGHAASITGSWNSITYGNGLFVAVSGNDKVMTSPDGAAWTTRTSAGLGADWNDITYGNGLFVAVSGSGQGMRSVNGVTWLDAALPSSTLVAITYGDGYFVALDQNVLNTPRTETTNGVTVLVATDIPDAQYPQLLTSPDGLVWANRDSPFDSWWSSITFGNGRFVAVSSEGYGDRVMRSGVVAVIAPAPDPAAIEAARIAEERAAIAEAARLRQIEIEKYRTILFTKLVRGERPSVADYRNAIFFQMTDRIVESVTDQILQLEKSKRSDVAAINSIADSAAFYDAFFSPLFPATIATYTRYGYTGVTERILEKVNAKVQELPLVKRTGTTSIQEIATIENFIDRVANPATRATVSSKILITNGLLPAESPYKYSVIKGLASYSESSLNTMEKIEAAIKAEIAKAEAPKLRLAAIKAKIATRKK